MQTNTVPTIGRLLHFFHNGIEHDVAGIEVTICSDSQDPIAPYAAVIIGVHKNLSINVNVWAPSGRRLVFHQIPVVDPHPDLNKLKGPYCCWMPNRRATDFDGLPIIQLQQELDGEPDNHLEQLHDHIRDHYDRVSKSIVFPPLPGFPRHSAVIQWLKELAPIVRSPTMDQIDTLFRRLEAKSSRSDQNPPGNAIPPYANKGGDWSGSRDRPGAAS